MVKKVDFYQRLREHLPDEAARLIAEEVVVEGKLLTEEHLDHRLETLELRLDNKMEQLRSSFFHWNLLFFVPLWIGVYGAIVAFVLKN